MESYHYLAGHDVYVIIGVISSRISILLRFLDLVWLIVRVDIPPKQHFFDSARFSIFFSFGLVDCKLRLQGQTTTTVHDMDQRRSTPWSHDENQNK
jgi:hypothetical protein